MAEHQIWSMSLAVLLMIAPLAGCGGSTKSATAEAEVDDAEQAEASETDETPPKRKDAGVGKKDATVGKKDANEVKVDLAGLSSVEAFEQTVYPVLREHCGKCHSEAPEGKGQLPLHASSDLQVAHDQALSKINLRQVDTSKLIQRQSIEGHNCWTKSCRDDGEVLRSKAQQWADAVADSLPRSTQPVPEGEVTEAQVLAWIAADRAKVSAADKPYIQYASLHRIMNNRASPDDMNTARAGISKILNSTSMYNEQIVNPVAVDEYALVYRFDVRDYWGWSSPTAKDPARAVDTWKRVLKGNYNADDQAGGPNTFGNKDTPANSLAKNTPTFPNIAGFFPEYTDGAQLGYTLSRPDVYADVMRLGTNSATLERKLGVVSTGIDSWKWATVDDAITLNKRMLLRSSTPSGFFWKGVDPFAMAPFIFYERPIPEFDLFSLVKTTPVFDADGITSYGITTDAQGNLVGGPQAQASEMIFSLPNGLQGYFIGGAANQIRVDAFPFIVVDPRRGGPTNTGFRTGPGADQRLLTPASCMACHMDGLNRMDQWMHGTLAKTPGKFDAKTMMRVDELYPTTPELRALIEKDRAVFAAAMEQVREGMVVGFSDKTLYYEPIEFLFEQAQVLFDYTPTASN